MQTRGNTNTTLSTEYAAQSDLRFTMSEIVSKEHSHKCSPRLRDTPMIGGRPTTVNGVADWTSANAELAFPYNAI